jgi:hypothetical protein
MFTSSVSLASGEAEQRIPQTDGRFPHGEYTPFGYLDNPFHCWNLHRSGVLRSSPGIGYGFYFPAGPGGYFDFAKNGVYEAHLRLGFLINGRLFWTSDDFQPGQLNSPYHSKNLQTFAFTEQDTRVQATFLQVGEDTIGATVEVHGSRSVHLMAALQCQLGGASWWGRDGLVGRYEHEADSAWIRSFAAGKVFLLRSDYPSEAHLIVEDDPSLRSWVSAPANNDQGLSYHPQPLYAALRFKLDAAQSARRIVLTRARNFALASEEAQRALGEIQHEAARKFAEDADFWGAAPRLDGDWPAHWKHGWVYDFETLRMVVRRPIGIYKHPWDAMQIQAPRTVLAESSIDAWALSYASAASAKEVVFGLFANAPFDGVPCSREDGEMNMVAADGSECGTSISWCYPFFCAASIWARSLDKQWLSDLYPYLVRFFRWTLKNRTDGEGFVIGKCSWETGMDASSRFLIHQPTGGELIEFLRIVELQAATSQAASVLARFAEVLDDTQGQQEWKRIQQLYATKTQTLWKQDWFYDFDTRNGQPVTAVGRDIGQVAPIFCGVANDEQKDKMRPALRRFFADSQAGHLANSGFEDWQDGLHWSSLVLPYVESLWSAEELELASEVIHAIADRVYTTTDRRSLTLPHSEDPGSKAPKLGWPGVSCEVWGAEGAYGGEGYGWGAVLPAHIIRSLVGFRDPQRLDELPLSPNLPQAFMTPGRTYCVLNLQYRGKLLDLTMRILDAQRIRVEGRWPDSVRSVAVRDATGRAVPLGGSGSVWQFDGNNHRHYFLRIAGTS